MEELTWPDDREEALGCRRRDHDEDVLRSRMRHRDEKHVAHNLCDLDAETRYPRVEFAVMDEESQGQKDDEDEGKRRHRHDLRYGRVGDSELVDDRWQNEGYSPATDAVSNPDHQEGNERGVLEKLFDLRKVPRVGLHGRCLLGEVRDESLTLCLGEELDSFGVWIVSADQGW